MKALSTNILVNHPSYRKILDAYNTALKTQGKVNDKKFWSEVIVPEIPDYALQTWYSFLKRFKTANGITEAEVTPGVGVKSLNVISENELAQTMLSNKEATAALIQAALNISAAAARRILENPHLLSDKEKVELGLKTMKAQDSRIHAIGKVREDNREEQKLERAFSDEAYAE